MWRRQDQSKPSSETPEAAAAPVAETPAPPSASPSPVAAPIHATANNPTQRASMAAAVSFESRLTGSLKIKGDITGKDALLVDAQVTGRIQLEGNVTVGPHGQVNASITAREIDIHGQLKGDLHGQDRVRIGATAETAGQILSRRIAIEDGAIVHGRVEVTHHASAAAPGPEHSVAPQAAAAAAPGAQAARSTPGPVAVPSPAKEPTAAA